MKKSQYIPYTGSAGPSNEQRDGNTLVLAQLLKENGIPFKKDIEYIKELCGVEQLLLKLERGDATSIYVGYDRWGYVIDGTDYDQISLEETLEILINKTYRYV